MPKVTLTEARVKALETRRTACGIRDDWLTSFVVQVRSSGGRSFILLREGEGRSRCVSLGSVEAKTIEQARREVP